MSLGRQYQNRGSIGTLIFISALGIGIKYMFSNTLQQLFSLMEVEEYSYVLTAFVVSLLLLAISLNKARYIGKIGLSHIFTAGVFILTSMVFYVLAHILLFYSLTLGMISMILFIWGLFILFYPREELRKLLLPLVSLSMLIPIPREILDPISVYLTQGVSILVSIFSGAEIISGPGGRVYLVTSGASGKVSFEIIAACSGIVSMTAFIALIPLFIYLTRNTSPIKRVLAVTISTIVGLIIVFLGNVLRVTIMVLTAKNYGVATAYALFHSTPSYIYSAIAVIVSIFIIYRIVGSKREIKPVKNITTRALRENYSIILIFLVFFIAVMSIGLYIHNNVASSPPSINVYHYSYDYILTHTLSIILKNDVKIVYEKPIPALERILGSSVVKAVGIRYNKSFFAGYVEFAETPSRFHGWWVCLTYQGYKVKRVWTEEANNLMITYIEYSKGKHNYLLGYTIVAVPLYTSNQKISTGYIRLSLFLPIRKDITTTAENFKNMLLNIIKGNLLQPTTRKREILETLSTADMILVLITTSYYVLAFISQGINIFIKSIRNKFWRKLRWR